MKISAATTGGPAKAKDLRSDKETALKPAQKQQTAGRVAMRQNFWQTVLHETTPCTLGHDSCFVNGRGGL
jgi:hypothetical protein